MRSVSESSSGSAHSAYQRIDKTAGSGSRLSAGDNAEFIVKGDINNLGSEMTAGGDNKLAAGGDINIASVETRQLDVDRSGKRKHTIEQIRQIKAKVAAGGDLSIEAGKDLSVKASDVTAAAGDLELWVDGETKIESAQDLDYDYRYKKKKKNG